jgi:hypothetical protein
MANGIRITGLSGNVSSVSVQSSVERSWAMIGRKWGGLRAKTHDVSMERDEVLAVKCQSGQCTLELKGLGGNHGDVIVQQDVSRIRLRRGERKKFHLQQDGAALVLTTTSIIHPLHRSGPIIET